MTVSALIADATPFVRLAVRSALEADGVFVCAEAATADEAVSEALRTTPDVVLIDADLDRTMKTVAEIGRALPEVALVVLAPSPSEDLALLAVRAGACGFLPKDTPPDRLAAVVHGALRGEAAIPRRLVRSLLTHLGHPAAGARAAGLDARGLSGRELDVLRMLAIGLTDRQVGDRLGISEVTVRRHVAGAMHKLGVTVREHAFEMFDRGAPEPADYIRGVR